MATMDLLNIKRIGRSVVLPVYRYLFIRRWLFFINKAIYVLSLRGIGILNSESDRISGESWFLTRFSCLLENSVVIDVGGNVGNYSNSIKKLVPTADVYAFEPHPKTFRVLHEQSIEHGYKAVNAGCGSENKKTNIYDYTEAENLGTSHASLYEQVISQIHSDGSRSWEVDIIALDDFIEKEDIDNIRLIKIDVEGGEMEVLNGMKKTILANKIDLIQLEFNEMNVFSRVFLRDIKDVLFEYDFYRLLPDGIVSLGSYSAVHWEIFAYQNIIAIHKLFRSEVKASRIRI